AAQIPSDLESGCIGIGEDHQPLLPGNFPEHCQLLLVLEDPEPAGFYNHCIQNGRQLCLVIPPFHHDGLPEMDHALSSPSSRNSSVMVFCRTIFSSFPELFSSK